MYRQTSIAFAVALLAVACPLGAQDTTTVTDRQLRQRLDTMLGDTRKSITELTQLLARVETLRTSVHNRVTRDSLAARQPSRGPATSGPAPSTTNSPANPASQSQNSGGPPSLPASSILVQDGFEPGNAGGAGSPFKWEGRPNTTREIARTGSYSMKFSFPGTSDTCEDAMAEQRFTMGENLPEAWFEYYVYLPNGNEGVGPRFVHRKPVCSRGEWPDPNGIVTNNKFFVVWADNYSTEGNVQVTVEYQRQTDSTSNIRVTGMKGDSRGMEATGTKHTSSLLDPSTRGRWVRMRVHVKTASAPGAYDGMVEVWRDDTLVYSLYNFDVVYAGGKNFFRNGYLMGWANSGFDQATSMYVDDFKIFRSNPGWR